VESITGEVENMTDEVENMTGEVEKIWKWWCPNGRAIKIFWSDWEKSETSWHDCGAGILYWHDGSAIRQKRQENPSAVREWVM
jgi:hypothetical protein